jgi:hypothetical protein
LRRGAGGGAPRPRRAELDVALEAREKSGDALPFLGLLPHVIARIEHRSQPAVRHQGEQRQHQQRGQHLDQGEAARGGAGPRSHRRAPGTLTTNPARRARVWIVASGEHPDVDAPEGRVRRRDDLLEPAELGTAFVLGAALHAERQPVLPRAVLGEAVLGDPSREQARAQLAHVLGALSGCAERGHEGDRNDRQRDQHLDQGESAWPSAARLRQWILRRPARCARHRPETLRWHNVLPQERLMLKASDALRRELQRMAPGEQALAHAGYGDVLRQRARAQQLAVDLDHRRRPPNARNGSRRRPSRRSRV